MTDSEFSFSAKMETKDDSKILVGTQKDLFFFTFLLDGD